MWHAKCDMWHNYKYSLLSLHMKTKVVQQTQTQIQTQTKSQTQKQTQTMSQTQLVPSFCQKQLKFFYLLGRFFVLLSHVTFHMSHVACHMSYVKCLCWSLGHAEQLLFSSVSSKVSICNYVKCHMSYIKCLNVDPWDMLNNFCFHVYAQKSQFLGENGPIILELVPS